MKENGRDSPRFRAAHVVPYALILVLKEESHESDVARPPRKRSPKQSKDRPETTIRPPVARGHPRFAKPQRVAFVQSSWHREVVEECRIAFLEEIEARGIARAQIDLFEVPGSFEIPLHAQILAKTRRYTAIVAAGLVVDGGIYRHEFVADTVIKALMDVQLRTEVPVFSAVLTPMVGVWGPHLLPQYFFLLPLRKWWRRGRASWEGRAGIGAVGVGGVFWGFVGL